MVTGQQKSLFEDYEGFVEKFKPKKTTDDCYTPENIYEVVASYVTERYGIQRADMVRPFWPGGDYERFEYPEGSCVVDNPPFSIITTICREYQLRKQPFFLFCPYLTAAQVTSVSGTTIIIAPVSVRYENGAEVNTAFVTNLEPENMIRSDSGLYEQIKAADNVNRKEFKKDLPKYIYPDDVLTVTKVGYFCAHGIDYLLKRSECCIIDGLDQQKRIGKSIFGNGYLLSRKAAAERAAAERAAAERAAAERAAAIKWTLSDREIQIQKMIESRKSQ